MIKTGQSGIAASAKTGGRRQSGNAGEPPSKRLKADITSIGDSPCEDGIPPSKQPCRKRKSQPSGVSDDHPSKKRRNHDTPAKKPANPPDKKDKSGAVPTRGPNHEWVHYRFYSVDERWQRDKCNFPGLPFHSPNGVSRGAPDLVLTQIDSTQRIRGDGNCLFRCFSYLITGSENHHFEIRSRLIEHMPNIPNVFTDTSVHSVDQYLRQSRMDRSRTWGTDKEVMALSHLLNTTIYTYTTTSGDWARSSPNQVDPSLHSSISEQSMYIRNLSLTHFDVVVSTVPPAARAGTGASDSK